MFSRLYTKKGYSESIENIFKQDPAKIFKKMTEKSQREYIRILKVLSKRNKKSEKDYAIEILNKAKNENRHIGSYLYDEYTRKKDFYPFLIMLVFCMFTVAFLPATYAMTIVLRLYGVLGIFLGIFTVVLICFISFNVVLPIVQKMYTDRKMPFFLPEMEFDGNLPENVSIMIVIPCLINSKERVDQMAEQLKAASWANPQKGICYTLLADLPEGKSHKLPNDNEIKEYTKKVIGKMGERFHVLIRDRVYYESDNIYRGYERKRGALIELNQQIICGELPKVKYVLTIDADSIIPINTALKLAQIMEHPLNKPVISYVKGEPIVTKGYAVLQPSIKSIIEKRENATFFEKIYAGFAQYVLYDNKSSDFYFDVCHEGIFMGKGMYEPYIFNAILENRFPDNTILSHDLLEGSFLRVGYVSDVSLYDYYPSSYSGYMQREHRWIRGDWQLLKVMKGRYCDKKGIKRNNPVNIYSRFKMLINLIRPLYMPVCLILLVIGSVLLEKSLISFALIVILILLNNYSQNVLDVLVKISLDFVFLPHKAINSLDAVIRAVYRCYYSYKNMLDWTVFSETDKNIKNSPLYYCRSMWPNFLFAAIFSPFLYGIPSVLWAVGPYIAFFISKKPRKGDVCMVVNSVQKDKYMSLLKKMWQYYCDYAVESDNFLPPDNVQFFPVNRVNHRTSPTNIGFLLVGIIIAEFFGFISSENMTERLFKVSQSIEKMEKWNGHIYNWYDTRTLQPLSPKYVSTVDNGNLAACILTVASYLSKFDDSNDIVDLQKKLFQIAVNMDFKPLYNKQKKQFSIGYDLEKKSLNESCYDILMSEARLASYVALAKGDIEPEHLASMSKCVNEKRKMLKSWSGTAFEYLMPELFMPAPYKSQLCISVYKMLDLQKECSLNGIWGVSESGYNETDDDMNYKYEAFGLKDAAVKEKNGNDMVIAPYVSLMASRHLPKDVYENIMRMEDMGINDKYGFYEAFDFTPNRQGIVKSYMAHHIGMSMCGVANLLGNDFVSKSFEDLPMFKSVKLMLIQNDKI